MRKYFKNLETETVINRKIGHAIKIDAEFYFLSSNIISQCSFIQQIIQQIIYTSHGKEISAARKALSEIPNPKSRVDFICDFQYKTKDITIDRVFNYARDIFKDIYELRNILAHEIWSSSEDHVDAVLFSTLAAESAFLTSNAKLIHDEDARSKEIFDSIIRFIRSLKIITLNDMHEATKDMVLCIWALSNIRNILDVEKEEEKAAAREAFFVFSGTSHLFPDIKPRSNTAEFLAKKEKTIRK
ncbi:hypothetical protein [Caulobacter radicis]|uniref:hypothetical protein n=1 Tax=Caulobacter radicis TaxID=2172650 RepID=UPI0010583244|nr:hypothetical protein [Caulobacter radicis]